MELYGGCYKALTKQDAEEMGKLNQKNGWGISEEEYFRLIHEHEQARKEGNIRIMEMIEYRLTDMNFHPECAALERGDYKTAKNLWED